MSMWICHDRHPVRAGPGPSEYLRHNVYYMCGFNWLPQCFVARKSVHADNVNPSASQVAAITPTAPQVAPDTGS